MSDLDALRAAVVDRELVVTASIHLTETIAMQLPFEELGPFKDSLKRFFSTGPWTDEDRWRISAQVVGHVEPGSWRHPLDDDVTLVHTVVDGMYHLDLEGTVATSVSIFDRAFEGPVIPVQTPHPRKVKFVVGGEPAPGRWYRRGDEVDEDGPAALMADPTVTDVMVAGDFVTVGLDRTVAWEDRLDDMIARVEELFWRPDRIEGGDETMTRNELLQEGRSLEIGGVSATDLHLMDPDRADHRETLVSALGVDDGRIRRAAVATLAMSGDTAVAKAAIVTGYADTSRMVRRAAIDSAADLEDDEYRSLFEDAALHDEDDWIRWKAVRAIAEIGAEPSAETLILAAVDGVFRVRFEANAALRN